MFFCFAKSIEFLNIIQVKIIYQTNRIVVISFYLVKYNSCYVKWESFVYIVRFTKKLPDLFGCNFLHKKEYPTRFSTLSKQPILSIQVFSLNSNKKITILNSFTIGLTHISY